MASKTVMRPIGNVRVIAVPHSIHCATRSQAVEWNAISLGNVAPLPRVGVKKKRDYRLARFPFFFSTKQSTKQSAEIKTLSEAMFPEGI